MKKEPSELRNMSVGSDTNPIVLDTPVKNRKIHSPSADTDEDEDRVAPSDSEAEEEDRVGPSDSEAEEEDRVGPTDSKAEEEDRIGPSDSETEEEDRVAPSDSEAGEEDRVGPSDSESEEEDHVAPSDSEAGEEDRVAPSDSETGEEDRVAPSDSEAGEEDRVAPSDSETEEEDRVAPSDSEAGEEDRVAPSDSEAEEQEDKSEKSDNYETPTEFSDLNLLDSPDRSGQQKREVSESAKRSSAKKRRRSVAWTPGRKSSTERPVSPNASDVDASMDVIAEELVFSPKCEKKIMQSVQQGEMAVEGDSDEYEAFIEQANARSHSTVLFDPSKTMDGRKRTLRISALGEEDEYIDEEDFEEEAEEVSSAAEASYHQRNTPRKDVRFNYNRFNLSVLSQPKYIGHSVNNMTDCHPQLTMLLLLW